MPKLKQPVSLQKIALNVLHKFVLDYCNELSVEDKLDELGQGVSIIKKHICSLIPWPLLGEFSNRFLVEFCSDERPNSHIRVALEIVMDMKIVGVRCRGDMIVSLDPKDLRRIRILEELDMQCFARVQEINFGNFRLDALTILIYPEYCTDIDLEVIGQNCPKLQVLKVPMTRVTDKGLRALSLCSELQVVDVFNCPVSSEGINSLLSVNEKMEELAHSFTSDDEELDEVSLLDSSVYPLMSCLRLRNCREVIPSDLQTIVTKFPNLTYLDMICSTTADLTILKSLNKLTGIDINIRYDTFGHGVEEMFESLLTHIGSNIITLKSSSCEDSFFWSQDDVNLVFTSCPNLEYFKFECAERLVVIPPFQKLKELIPRPTIESGGLEFGIMPNLETLSLLGYGMTVTSIEAMMLDDIKFPKLSVIETKGLKADEIMQLEEIARIRNLDFEIKNDPGSNWYYDLFHGR